MKLLIANRGEIAVRIALAAGELGIETVAVYSEDDAQSLHVRRADAAAPLVGTGVPAYLDGQRILRLAHDHGCDAVHPGYGFLSEAAEFARQCVAGGIQFVGPTPEALALFGDKVQCRRLAEECGVPVVPGISAPVTLAQAQGFFEALPSGSAMLLKAVAGGGGRGIRVVSSIGELDRAFERARSEARAAFGDSALFVERDLRGARHVEVQIAADSRGAVAALGDRDCSLQRRHQKLVEVAPAPLLSSALRRHLADAAVTLARAGQYRNLGTFEFLVEGSGFAFIEANARLQVEHTVTEETTGVDLVQLQLQLAGGKGLGELGLLEDRCPPTRGFAAQVRVNLETMEPDGDTTPSIGILNTFEVPLGRGVRVDTFAYAGYESSPRFDSLIAKVVGHSEAPDFTSALQRASLALRDFRITGVETNIGLLLALLAHPEVRA